MVGLTGAVAISGGGYHTCARFPNGTLQCWGLNDGDPNTGARGGGQLGNPATGDLSPTPVPVTGITTATAVTAGGFHTCALLPNGTVQCWGQNDQGQLGNGTTDPAPPTVAPRNATPVAVSGINNAIAVSAGGWHTCALLQDGTVRCWGRNDFGQIGDGSQTARPPTPNFNPTPVTVRGITTAVALKSGIFHACVLLRDGRMQCWGWNDFQQLGDPASINYSSVPVTVPGITPAALAPGAEHTCVLLQDGRVNCWGDTQYGQSGNGSRTGIFAPPTAPVTGITTATAATSGAEHSCALLPGGRVQCWGRGLFGRLGDGLDRSQPGDDAYTPVTTVSLGVTWTSSNTTVATITADGVATGLNPGSTTITATSGGRSGSATLTVGAGPRPRLSVTRDGTGGGAVTSNPPGIDCGTTCSAPYDQGTMVTLTAAAATSSTFNGWTGCDTVSGTTCAVTMSAARSVTATFNLSPPDGGVVAAYAFDEGSGTTTADLSGNNRTATISGATWTTGGRFGDALSFDGVGSRVTASTVTLGPSFTLMAWVFNPTAAPYETIMTVGGSRDFFLGNGVIGFYDGSTERTFGGAISTNTWHHVALVHDGATLRAYLDGTPQGTEQAVSLPAITGVLQIGAWIVGASNGDFFGGRIDEVRVSNRALSQAEVQQVMNTPVGTPPTDTTPPGRSSGQPTGTLPAGTTQATLSLVTDEAATCRYATTRGVVYSAMAGTFTTTGGTSHATTVGSLADGGSYTFYVRCQDGPGNVNTDDFTIAFSVASPPPPQRFPLTVTKAGSGRGTVTSSAGGLDCPATSATCSASYDSGTRTTLTARPASGSSFGGWSGCDTVSGTSCTVTMSAARSVTATFNPQSFILTVTKAGAGRGAVTSSAGGLDCPATSATCSASYDSGTRTTLTARPASGSSFGGWSGCDTVSGTSCTVTMSAARSVTATFGAGVVSAPVLKWQDGGCTPAPAGGPRCLVGWYSSPAVADLDGDGQPDVIWGSSGDVVALRGDNGNLKWRASSSNRVWADIAVADLTGDGTPEVIVGRAGDELTVYDRFGGVVWTRNPFGVGETRTLAVADLDNDGRREIIVGRADPNGPWPQSSQVTVFEPDGSVRPGWPARRDGEPGFGGGMYNENVAVADMNGDGFKEVFGSSGAHYMMGLDRNGNQLTVNGLFAPRRFWSEVGIHVDQAADLRGYANCGVEHRPTFSMSAPVVADVNGDGVPELIVVGNIYNCSGYASLYQIPFILNRDRTRWSGSGFDWTVLPTPRPGSGPRSEDASVIEVALANPVVADLDGDGFMEIIYPSYDGRVHAYWLDKTEHGSWPYTVPTTGAAGDDFRFASEPAVVDLNNDGCAEVIFTSWPRKNVNGVGQLHILNCRGEELYRIDLPAPSFGRTWNGGMAAPTIADIDGDGNLDVVIGTVSTGVVAYELPNSAGARVLWGTGRGSYRRAGTAELP